MLQAILKAFVILPLLRLFNNLCGHHVQVGAYIEVDDSHIKHCSDPPLSEAIGVYICPLLYRYCYMSRTFSHINRPVYGPSISSAPLGLSLNVLDTVRCLHSLLAPISFLSYCTVLLLIKVS